jgi:hypothetical protein
MGARILLRPFLQSIADRLKFYLFDKIRTKPTLPKVMSLNARMVVEEPRVSESDETVIATNGIQDQ